MTSSDTASSLTQSAHAGAKTFVARPIVSIGAGGIVQSAHLPAYRKAGFPVSAVIDPDGAKAASLAAEFGVEKSFTTLAEALPHIPAGEAVYDIAVPASVILKVLPQLPDGSAVLIQKPIGETLAEAVSIEKICREKGLVAAAN